MESLEKKQTLTLENRQKLTLSGVLKVDSVSPASLALSLHGCKLMIVGSALEVKRFDQGAGLFEVTGRIDALKYIDRREPENLLKKIFK